MRSVDSKHVPLSRRNSPESSRNRRGKRSECGHPSSFCIMCGLLLKRQQTVSLTLSGHAHAARVYSIWSAAILALQATRRPMSDTNGFWTTKFDVREIMLWKQAKRLIFIIAVAYLNLIFLLCVYTLEAQEVITKDVNQLSNAIY